MLYDNILVPFDGSASADAALEEAVRYAKEDPGCALHVLQISDIEHQVIERDVRLATRGLMNEIHVEVQSETTIGVQIVAYAAAHNIDLIIMGSRGLGGLRGILGSVSSFVLKEAKVPVLVVKD